jgi:septal ring factor EnvC (AmiA/AmiB activator)
MEEVKELSNLVMALQENLRSVQNDYIQVLMRAEADSQHRVSLEETLQLVGKDLENSRSQLEESRHSIQSLQFELRLLQEKQEHRERLMADFDEEKETYLEKIRHLQSRLKESEEALRESDHMRNSSLAEMRQEISQFKIDLEFATSHISLLSSQKAQAESELASAKSRGSSLREEIDSLNISFNSVVQNLQNATSLLSNKTQGACPSSPPFPAHYSPLPRTAETQLTARVEELEEQLKSKIIALQRSALASKEVELSSQEASDRYAACERELQEARQMISKLQSDISQLTDECQRKARELKASECRIMELENANRDLNVLQGEAEQAISQLDVTVAERAKDCRELEEKLAAALKKIAELERIQTEAASGATGLPSEVEYQALREKNEEAMRALHRLEELASKANKSSPLLPTEEAQAMRETISVLQRERDEAKARLESEIAERETLTTRAQYLEDMLESISSSQSSVSASVDATVEEKLQSLETDRKRAAQEILDLKRELEEARRTMPCSSAEARAGVGPAAAHPVYDIFGLPENFEATPSASRIPSRSPSESAIPAPQLLPPATIEVAKSSSSEKSLPSEKSERRISRAPDSQRQRKVKPSSSSRSPVREEAGVGDKASTSSLVSQKSSQIKSSPSFSSAELPDPKAYKTYCKKLQADISALRKDRQAVKKDIIAWNAQFEKDNDREPTREEKESLASELYDRYQDVSLLLLSLS